MTTPQLYIYNNQIVDNHTNYWGGGIHNSGTLVAINSEFIDNTAIDNTNWTGGGGSAIVNYSTLTAACTTFRNNHVSPTIEGGSSYVPFTIPGGAVYTESVDTHVHYCNFIDNTASGQNPYCAVYPQYGYCPLHIRDFASTVTVDASYNYWSNLDDQAVWGDVNTYPTIPEVHYGDHSGVNDPCYVPPVPLPPEPPTLALWVEDDFEGFTDTRWALQPGWEYMSVIEEPSMALYVSGTDDELVFGEDVYEDVGVQARLWVERDEAEVRIRQSTAGVYILGMSSEGEVRLTRQGQDVGDYQVLYETEVENIQDGPPWHTVWLSAVDDTVEITVDEETFTWTDPDPLPAGTVAFVGADDQTSLFVDDFELWLPEDQVLAMKSPRPITTAATETGSGHGLLRPDNPFSALSAQLEDLPLEVDLVFQASEASGAPDAYRLQTGISDQPMAVIQNTAWDTQPALSRDGQRVAVATWENGCTTISVWEEDEGEYWQVVDVGGDAVGCYNGQPVWSNDGQYLAFVSRDGAYGEDAGSRIIIANANNGQVEQVLLDDAYSDWSPTFSPNGDELAFVSYRPVQPGDDPDGKPRTFIINRFSGDIRAIGEVYDVDPAWSPDGNWIAVSNRGPVGGLLRLLDPYSSYAQTLDEIGQHPSWSNNSEYIAFHLEFEGQTEIYLLNVYDYSEPVLLYIGGHFPDLGLVRQVMPTPTPEPSGTPETSCEGRVIPTLMPPYQKVTLRYRPGGEVVGYLDPGAPINLIDGANDPYDQWWWHITSVEAPIQEGYLRVDLVDNYNDCQMIESEPPLAPTPQPNEECYVKLQGVSAQVRDGANTVIREITDPDERIRVYGTSYDRARLLISLPGILPQEWVNRSLFINDPLNARACRNTVLGRFYATAQQGYWTTVGAYANDFLAPISSVQYNNEYADFRNSYHYSPGDHEGTDLVYGPPNGTGSAIPFAVHAQADGVIVDAGPDGITKAYRFERNYCGETTVDGNRFPNRSGVFYWTVPIDENQCGTTEQGEPIEGIKEIYFFAVMGNEDQTFTLESEKLRERPSTGYYPFGLRAVEIDDLQRVRSFVNVCDDIPDACVTNSPGRRLLIWYDVEDNGEPNEPDIQTVYYHVAVDSAPKYEQWHSTCSSADRNATWSMVIIENDPEYVICNVAVGDYLGNASRIGFTTAAHLHYEVYIDRNFDRTLHGADDREDPLMAFQTIR